MVRTCGSPSLRRSCKAMYCLSEFKKDANEESTLNGPTYLIIGTSCIACWLCWALAIGPCIINMQPAPRFVSPQTFMVLEIIDAHSKWLELYIAMLHKFLSQALLLQLKSLEMPSPNLVCLIWSFQIRQWNLLYMHVIKQMHAHVTHLCLWWNLETQLHTYILYN